MPAAGGATHKDIKHRLDASMKLSLPRNLRSHRTHSTASLSTYPTWAILQRESDLVRFEDLYARLDADINRFNSSIALYPPIIQCVGCYPILHHPRHPSLPHVKCHVVLWTGELTEEMPSRPGHGYKHLANAQQARRQILFADHSQENSAIGAGKRFGETLAACKG